LWPEPLGYGPEVVVPHHRYVAGNLQTLRENGAIDLESNFVIAAENGGWSITELEEHQSAFECHIEVAAHLAVHPLRHQRLIHRNAARGESIAIGGKPQMRRLEVGVEPHVGDAPVAEVQQVIDEAKAAAIIVGHDRRKVGIAAAEAVDHHRGQRESVAAQARVAMKHGGIDNPIGAVLLEGPPGPLFFLGIAAGMDDQHER